MAKKMSAEIQLRDLINMTNGVLGLAILAMPFCFAQAGLVLASITLFLCALMTSFSCRLLMRTVEINKIRTFEFLAWKLFGHRAKLFLEICLILLMFGTLVTYQQILSDSGPTFLSRFLGFETNIISREVFMVIFTVCITMPMSLLRRIDKINKISTCSITFYFIFAFYLIFKSSESVSNPDFSQKIVLWDFGGLIKVMPILSVSLSCQPGWFVIYGELPDHSREFMTRLVDYAISVSFTAYFLAGFFGYIAFYNVEIHGNAITNIPESSFRQLILFGFIICVLSGSAICIFPCRNSLNTFLFSSERDDVLDNEIVMSDYRFRNLTIFIVTSVTLTAILIPNMEFMLSLSGATAGSLIAFVWPSLMYIYARPRTNSFKEILVNFFFAFGIVMFFVCTITSLLEYHPTKENEIVSQVETNLQESDDLEKTANSLKGPVVNQIIYTTIKDLLQKI